MAFNGTKPFPELPQYEHHDDEIIVLKGHNTLRYKIDDLAFINHLEVGQAFIAALMHNNKSWSDYPTRVYYKDNKGNLTAEFIAASLFFNKAKNDFEKINYCLTFLNEKALTLSDEALADLSASA